MKYDYYKGDLNRNQPSYGGMAKKEKEVRKLVVDSLTQAKLNAEEAFFGVLLYHEGKAYKLVIREDD